MNRRFWLASYPKSGSTWFRMLIANLGRDRPVDINRLPPSPSIASAREPLDTLMLVSSGLLHHDECDLFRPASYRAMARTRDADPGQGNGIGGARFVKTHDAWTLTTRGEPLMGGAGAASGAILIVRDPRDIVASLANHNGEPIDRTIAFMDNARASFCGSSDRQDPQLRQRLQGWSGFNESWIGQRAIPVHLVRYEDMHADASGVLTRALKFAGVAVSPDEVRRAANFAAFAELRTQERRHGFGEAPVPRADGNFFRRGIVGGWRDELTREQAAQVESGHAAMMARLGYDITEKDRACA